MKHTANIILVLIILLFTACEQGHLKIPENAMEKIKQFKAKEKFLQDDKSFYTGLGDPKLQPILNKKINLIAEDFKEIANKNNSTDKDYQRAIRIGLDRFSDIYLQLDTEDREKICTYIEELMDIIGLESSDGYLNNFMYGFNPTKNDKN